MARFTAQTCARLTPTESKPIAALRTACRRLPFHTTQSHTSSILAEYLNFGSLITLNIVFIFVFGRHPTSVSREE